MTPLLNALVASHGRRALLAAAVAATLAAPWAAAHAQSSGGSAYPSKPVRIIVGFPAGTGPDIVDPAKTPPEIIERLNEDILKAVQSPEGKASMEEAGFRVTGTSQQAFSRIIAADTVTWGKAVAATGFKAD